MNPLLYQAPKFKDSEIHENLNIFNYYDRMNHFSSLLILDICINRFILWPEANGYRYKDRISKNFCFRMKTPNRITVGHERLFDSILFEELPRLFGSVHS